MTLGAARWAALIHKMPPTFAAQMTQKVTLFDDAQSRENAKQTFRIAQAGGMMNGRELITAIDTLNSWAAAEPGAKCAVLVAMIEVSGGCNKDNALRVLAREEYR